MEPTDLQHNPRLPLITATGDFLVSLAPDYTPACPLAQNVPVIPERPTASPRWENGRRHGRGLKIAQ